MIFQKVTETQTWTPSPPPHPPPKKEGKIQAIISEANIGNDRPFALTHYGTFDV